MDEQFRKISKNLMHTAGLSTCSSLQCCSSIPMRSGIRDTSLSLWLACCGKSKQNKHFAMYVHVWKGSANGGPWPISVEKAFVPLRTNNKNRCLLVVISVSCFVVHIAGATAQSSFLYLFCRWSSGARNRIETKLKTDTVPPTAHEALPTPKHHKPIHQKQ